MAFKTRCLEKITIEMITPRLIGRLDIKNKNLIKPINLEGLRIVGDPNKFAKKYYEEGIDEIILMDTVATLYSRNYLSEIITNITKEIFIPITVGGGVRNLEDANILLNAGADKIAVNTAAVKNPNLIKEIADQIGSQSLVISIDAKKRTENFWEVYTNNGRDRTEVDVVDWIKKVQDLGAGEILLTSIDQEGTRKGFDYDLIKLIYKTTNVPLILSGGFGDLSHIKNLKRISKIDAIAVADAIHYDRFPIKTIKENLNG